mgnify:CR=1 FL=1
MSEREPKTPMHESEIPAGPSRQTLLTIDNHTLLNEESMQPFDDQLNSLDKPALVQILRGYLDRVNSQKNLEDSEMELPGHELELGSFMVDESNSHKDEQEHTKCAKIRALIGLLLTEAITQNNIEVLDKVERVLQLDFENLG